MASNVGAVIDAGGELSHVLGVETFPIGGGEGCRSPAGCDVALGDEAGSIIWVVLSKQSGAIGSSEEGSII